MRFVGKEKPAWHEQEDLFIVPPGGWLLAGLLLLSVALAGSRPLWAQGVVTLCVGLLWAVWPPTRAPGKEVVWMIAALALAPLAAYLPQAWVHLPEWRNGLEAFRAIQASPFVTPQPWFTFHTWLLWLAGVALATWCASQQWDHYHRATLARLYAGGLVAIAAFAVYSYSTGNNPAIWQSEHKFGPFLNRNQWGTVLGMGGIAALALVHQSVRRRRKRAVAFWAASLALLAGAVVANGSRGGLLVLAAGCAAYWMFYGLARKEYRYAAIGVSFLLISFAAFSLGGGPLLERFVSLRDIVQVGADEDFRLQFYRMTRAMLADAPLTGFGLGNFEFVLPFYLDFAAVFNRRPVHPESSFLWLASEGGWILVVTVGAAFAMVLWLGHGARRSRASTIRAAGMACALMLVFNAFFEVSGHRIGALFPAIFLASLALPPAAGGFHGRAALLAMRAAGAALAVIGILWIATGFGRVMLPAAQGTSALRAEAGRAHDAGDAGRAISLLRESGRLQPLDWSIHWTLAAYLLEQKDLDPAWNEFRATAALLPYMDWIIEKEGHFWLPVSPARAAYAWSEALRRTAPSRRSSMYAGMLAAAAGNAPLRSLLLRFYPDDPEFEFERFRAAGKAGGPRLARLLAKTDNLAYAPDQLVEPVMRAMLDRSLYAQLDAMAARDQRVRRLGWRMLAERAQREGHLDEALELHFQYGPKPALPAPISRSDLRTIERAAVLAPMDIATAIAYYQALDAARRKDDAFWQLRRIMESPNAPAYIWFLAAKAAHERGDHKEAWEFLRTYETKSKP